MFFLTSYYCFGITFRLLCIYKYCLDAVYFQFLSITIKKLRKVRIRYNKNCGTVVFCLYPNIIRNQWKVQFYIYFYSGYTWRFAADNLANHSEKHPWRVNSSLPWTKTLRSSLATVFCFIPLSVTTWSLVTSCALSGDLYGCRGHGEGWALVLQKSQQRATSVNVFMKKGSVRGQHGSYFRRVVGSQ